MKAGIYKMCLFPYKNIPFWSPKKLICLFLSSDLRVWMGGVEHLAIADEFYSQKLSIVKKDVKPRC
jgi:integral membrane sensor domain MASE1